MAGIINPPQLPVRGVIEKEEKEPARLLELRPPFALVKLRAGTRTFRLLVEALRKTDVGVIARARYLGSIKRSVVVETAREILASLDVIRYVFFKPSEGWDSSNKKVIRLPSKSITISAYYDVQPILRNIYAAPGMKCYSVNYGCFDITDVLVLDSNFNLIESKRLWRTKLTTNKEKLLRKILPSEVLEAVVEGKKKAYQVGGVWLLPARRSSSTSGIVKAGMADLFGRYRLYGNPVLVRIGRGNTADKVLVRDPSLETIYGTDRTTARGWFKVTWIKKKRKPVVERSEDGSIRLSLTPTA